MLERFTILQYNHTSSKVNKDEASQKPFTMKGWAVESITPTRAALVQHNKRSTTYHGGNAGARCCRLKLACHLLGTRVGLTHKTGGQCRPLYLRLVLLQGNLSAMGARRDAQGTGL